MTKYIRAYLISTIILFEISYAKQPNNAKIKQYVNMAESYINKEELNRAYECLQNAESLTTDKKQLAYIYKKMGEIAERKKTLYRRSSILYT